MNEMIMIKNDFCGCDIVVTTFINVFLDIKKENNKTKKRNGN